MAMSKKDFIALADAISNANQIDARDDISLTFKARAIETLANFCQSQNSRFKRERWMSYIAGECGKNGGAVKKSAA